MCNIFSSICNLYIIPSLPRQSFWTRCFSTWNFSLAIVHSYFAIKILLRADCLHRRHVIKYILAGPNINGINQRNPDKHPRGGNAGAKTSVSHKSIPGAIYFVGGAPAERRTESWGQTISSSFFHIPADRIFYPALRHKARYREIRIRHIIVRIID